MNPSVTINHTTATTEPTHFYVRSSKDPNRMYDVAVDHGFLRCSCPAAIYRPTKPCRHIRSVVVGEALVARPKAPARPTVGRAGAVLMEGLN
ncbi:MAG TPA: hypothetical protein VGW38_25610, partial [Chloroflexota bacterium]|nr:hypothetical protein [Chloroflexota bacterium]